MTTPVIIDVIVAAILVAAAVWGAHRGLFRSLAGLAVVVVALVGAAVIANALAAPAARLVTPLIRDHIETRVDEAMAQLPGKYRAVVHLFYYEGYQTEEIARLLGRSPSTVRAQLTRARQRLRELLKEDL